MDAVPEHRLARAGGRQALIEEAAAIVKTISRVIEPRWDGRTKIIEMRDSGSTQWRQMEWIGFYFEEIALRALFSSYGGEPGPKYGRTTFDYQCRFVWDLKAHPSNGGSPQSILNDHDAIRGCLRDTGAFGVVVLEGHAEYDENGSFKDWHDAIKGGRSQYELERVARGAGSRRRKTAFTPSRCFAVAFNGETEFDRAIRERWVATGF